MRAFRCQLSIAIARALKLEGFETADGDRPSRVLSHIPHFNGQLIPDSVQLGRTGFASKDLEQRRIALWALYGIMQTWSKVAPISKNISSKDVDLADFHIACYYTYYQ